MTGSADPRPTILAVDDDSWNLTLVESVLDDTGYRIVTAESGAAALDLVAGSPPDAILLDVMMPGMDGFEVCRRLKSSRRTFFINAYENFRLESPQASPDTWASQLRAEAAAGKFHPSLVEGIVRAQSRLPEAPQVEDLPEIVDLLPVPAPPAGGRILIADDSATNREIYHEILSDAGYTVRAFASGDALLDAIRVRSPDLVITDVRMPGTGGEDVCRRLKSDPQHAFLPVILVTAHVEAASKERALASGADELLSVPVDRHELLARVRSLLRLGAFRSDLEQGESVVLSLSGMLETKDPATNGHSARVADLAVRLAREMGLGEETAATLRTAGLLHDIGKIAIPERILHQEILSREDLELLETHPQRGVEICQGLHSARDALPVIRHHHEQADGSGYPDGLAGDAIPLGARVLGVANAFDVLTLRVQLSPEEAIERLGRETEEGKWDPDVTRALETLHREDRLVPPVGDQG